MTDLHDDLSAMLAETIFHAYGFRILAVGDGMTRLLVPALATNLRPGGIIAGAVLIAAADVAAWLAIKTLLGRDDASVTIDLHAAFTSAARGDVTTEAAVVRCGARIVVVSVRSTHDDGVVAIATVTYARAGAPR
jgi:uncharacterized protein (TIGR00369 family)